MVDIFTLKISDLGSLFVSAAILVKKDTEEDVSELGGDGNNGNDSSDVYTHLSKDSMLTFFRVSTSDKIEFMYQWQFCITFLIDITILSLRFIRSLFSKY